MYRILVVEDEERLCSAIVAYLKSLGADPLAVSCVKEAVSKLEEEFALVILDLGLAQGSGLELLKYIRSTPRLVQSPVIVMLDWEMTPMSYDHLKPGDYLTKPFDMRVLDLMIRQLLKPAEERYQSASEASPAKMTSMDAG